MYAQTGYTILETEFLLCSPSQPVSEGFHHLLSGFQVPDPSSLKSPTVIDVLIDPDSRYRVLRNGCLLSIHDAMDDLLAQTEWSIQNSVYRHMNQLAIHAGAVVLGNRTLLLPGRSGCGKSTLVLSLVLNKSAQLLSDEIAPVIVNNGRILGYPRVLCAKRGSIDLLRKFDTNGVLDRPGTVSIVNGVGCVSSASLPKPPPETTRFVDLIVFPNYHRRCEARLDRISKSRALMNLMRNSIAGENFPNRGLGLLGGVVENADCYSLQSSTVHEAIELLSNLIEGTNPNHEH